jgi:ankyrin repeat protein
MRKSATDLINSILIKDVHGVKRLLALGHCPNSREAEHNQSALMLAAQREEMEILSCLMQAGADIELRDDTERTALMLAASAGRTTAVRALVENKANINSRDQNRLTALHHSVHSVNIECVTVLLENGADCGFTDSEGQTAKDIAATYGFSAIVELLEHAMEQSK